MTQRLTAILRLGALLIVAALAIPSTPASAAEPMRDWNFLVFLNGVNNLDRFGTLNINQMEQVGSSDRLNILVQWGSSSRPSVDRLRVIRDNDKKRVTSPIVQSLGPADMGSAREFVDFVRWAHENYPARRTFIVIWNHGNGWYRPESIGEIGLKDISYDDRTGNRITTEELGVAMREISGILGKKVDVYSSDACLMGMVEIADEMADGADYFVGSQDLEPGEGWPYTEFLRAWSADMDRSPADVAKLLSKEYLKSYSGGIYGRRWVTMSVYDLGKIEPLRRAMGELSSHLAAQPAEGLAALKVAATRAKRFFHNDYRDLIDFLNQATTLPAEVTAPLRAAHADFVIANDQNQDQVTHGLSLWLPTRDDEWSEHAERYQGLSFHRQTGWADFLKKLLGK